MIAGVFQDEEPQSMQPQSIEAFGDNYPLFSLNEKQDLTEINVGTLFHNNNQ